ncbi:hypothetical protein NQZ68_003884 [Dissostichus eleginoides]|nr:hypothetical protein NQZ68_003884 [Dissostichus eleginoides]
MHLKVPHLPLTLRKWDKRALKMVPRRQCLWHGARVGRSQRQRQQQQQQRHSLTPASEQHGRPSTQQRVAPELGGGTQLAASGLTFRSCYSGKPRSRITLKRFHSFQVSTPRTRKLDLTKDGDYKRGIPQMDITGHGHEDQMFAVKRIRLERRE